jgi:hypothetical protein
METLLKPIWILRFLTPGMENKHAFLYNDHNILEISKFFTMRLNILLYVLYFIIPLVVISLEAYNRRLEDCPLCLCAV